MPRDFRRSNSRSPRRSRSRSRSHDRYNRRDERDRYTNRDRDRDNGRSPRRSRSRSPPDENEGCRVHIADLTDTVSKYDIEKAFRKYGDLKEVWMAKNPPCFAFAVFKNKQDADAAVRDMDNRTIGNSRVKVSIARPRTKGRRRQFDPNMRCYQCGQRGHFSRDCDSNYRRRHERSYSRDRFRGRSRSRTRSPRRRSFSRSPRRERDRRGGSIIRNGNGHMN